MSRNYFFIIVYVALACLVLIFLSLWWEIESPVTKEPPMPPPVAPYPSYIAGVGIVEPSTENISIGTPVNRIVDKITVSVGEKVKKGEVLLRLENKDLEANLSAQEAAYKSALAKLQRLEAFPRIEDLLTAELAVASSKAALDLAKEQNDMVSRLTDQRAISQEEKNRRLFNFQHAEAEWLEATANFEKIKSGTWKPDLEIAHFEVQEEMANIERIEAEIQRTIIRSPIDGTVLQIKIHVGEFASPDTFRMPLMVLGNTDELFLRVSINQLDIPHFKSDAPAVAFSQGDAQIKFPLEFVRVEPFLVSKQNLTNEITENVDTRVLQIIYKIKKENFHIFVGQQMDVFISANFHHEP